MDENEGSEMIIFDQWNFNLKVMSNMRCSILSLKVNLSLSKGGTEKSDKSWNLKFMKLKLNVKGILKFI